MPRAKAKACETCIHWRKFKKDAAKTGKGHCLRYAPRPAAFRVGTFGWPTTEKDDVCGEHEAKT